MYLGGPGGPSLAADWTAEGDTTFGYFGYAVGAAGDLNADGYGDLVVGAYSAGRRNGGSAYVYLGSAAGLSLAADWSVVSQQQFSELGTCAAGVGDVNGDGFDDVAVGADRYCHGQREEGVVLVYHGSAAGPSATPDWVVPAVISMGTGSPTS